MYNHQTIRILTKRILYYVLLLFLLADIGYSFFQHLAQPIDGDMAWCIVPHKSVKPILEDPFGLEVLLNDQIYPNPNRFFFQWGIIKYFVSVPIFLQKFVEPIESVYLSCAIAKILIQITLIFFLAMTITGTSNFRKLEFMVAAVLVTPLFQTNGYSYCMGIIDSATSYTFLYALPSALLLLYFLPFIYQFYYKKKTSVQFLIYIFWIPLAIVICFSGPLNPGVVLIFSMLVILKNLINNYFNSSQKGFIKKATDTILNIPKSYWFYFLPISILSLYSLFIGRNNSFTITYKVPLKELYLILPKGIYHEFIYNRGFLFLYIILVINILLISIKYRTTEGKKILTIIKWIVAFAILYFLLLPLGGYRLYRPNILRYDTMMPVTLCLFFMFGITTLFLFRNMANKLLLLYIPTIIIILFIYTYSDQPLFDKNNCERSALKEISESNDTIVKLQHDCTVVAWEKISKPEDSDLNAQLLKIWRITDEKKLYYNKQ